ncbi:hypothetical protein ACMD2_04523 [Ananas comosus]|uniref:Uncharacterized protein n=1 Tax=Ananas comosus TaxID=4615 RepID=A0A199VGD6_ANACO|nr:hypothetical protein ACMD2_04523 [Ananas comosus]
MTTRVSAKPPVMANTHRCKARSSSPPSIELRYDESSVSATILASERTEESVKSRPNYMNLTESTKAKQKVCGTQRTVSPGESIDGSSPVSFSSKLGNPIGLSNASMSLYDLKFDTMLEIKNNSILKLKWRFHLWRVPEDVVAVQMYDR